MRESLNVYSEATRTSISFAMQSQSRESRLLNVSHLPFALRCSDTINAILLEILIKGSPHNLEGRVQDSLATHSVYHSSQTFSPADMTGSRGIVSGIQPNPSNQIPTLSKRNRSFILERTQAWLVEKCKCERKRETNKDENLAVDSAYIKLLGPSVEGNFSAVFPVWLAFPLQHSHCATNTCTNITSF